ncbi:MAG: hypothetical protein OEV66_04295 [Spirochaetia bacterium]|nr:hypothetical protein [Spirochaetia bacterium]
MINTVHAIYETINSMAGFLKVLSDWFGFAPIIVLMGLLFFFKLFQSLFPGAHFINMIFSFASFTALWSTWNLNYYHNFHLLSMMRIYSLIFLHIISIVILFNVLKFFGKIVHKKFFMKPYSLHDTIIIYDLIDETARAVKQQIREGNRKEALRKLIFLKEALEKSKHSGEISHETNHEREKANQ